jgi:hypothetical protein
MPARTSWRDWDSRCTAWLITGCSVAKARDRSISDTNKAWRRLIRSMVAAINLIDGVEVADTECSKRDGLMG